MLSLFGNVVLRDYWDYGAVQDPDVTGWYWREGQIRGGERCTGRYYRRDDGIYVAFRLYDRLDPDENDVGYFRVARLFGEGFLDEARKWIESAPPLPPKEQRS